MEKKYHNHWTTKFLIMKRVIIICEGETEKEFCTKILSPFFISKNIFIQSPLIKKSMGGIVRWSILKREIDNYLKEKDVFVTTLIDYYGLYSKYQFPAWEESNKVLDKNKRMDVLEKTMSRDIEDSVKHRFFPYIQLHEFEGLLFNDINIFYEQIPPKELINITLLKQTFQDYPDNPEMINNNKETSPSNRLMSIISGYNKIVHGNYLADAIGLDRSRNKSPRFNKWLQDIENL